jgi:hypothetical protein
MSDFRIPDKTYYIFAEVDLNAEKLRSKINNLTYIKDRKRNVKKYELLNALVTVGLNHVDETLNELGLKLTEKDLKQ